MGEAIVGGVIGGLAGCTAGVSVAGSVGDETGSVGGAFLGTLLGSAAGFALALGTPTDEEFGLLVLTPTVAALGATIGFNLDRRYDPPAYAGSAAVIDIRDGQTHLSVPRVGLRVHPVDGTLLRSVVLVSAQL